MHLTIKDVAREVGVSKATVSKYLNGAPHVAEETRQRIAAVVERLQFQPNRAARGLSKRRSNTIGLVLANVANPFYAELFHGAEEVTSATGYTLLLASTGGDPKKERAIIQAMHQQQVDGVVFASMRMADREVAKLAREGTQVVLASRHLPEAGVDYVVVDSLYGGRVAVEHLIKHGHRRIGYIGGPSDIFQFQERLRGYHEALQRAGLSIDPELCVETNPLRIEDGDLAARKLLALTDPPTAIFATTDNLAFGVLRACLDLGFSVPEQLALIGFDNVPFGEVSLCPLTSVDGHGLEIGRRATQRLIDKLAASEADASRAQRVRMIIEPRLCIRRSCGCNSALEAR
jgi:DNA-binding LacI/PurR family transcriptional regulator